MGWVILGMPCDEFGGTCCTAKSGFFEVVWFARETATPLPWVYCRWVFTHDGDGTFAEEIWRTPISTGVSFPSSV